MSAYTFDTLTPAQRASVAQASRQRGTGCTRAVCDVLRAAGVPMTAAQVHARLAERFNPAQVRSALHGTRGVFCDGAMVPRFSLQPWRRDERPAARHDGPVRAGAPTPLVGYHDYLVSNWRLCTRDPFDTSRSAVFSHRGSA